MGSQDTASAWLNPQLHVLRGLVHAFCDRGFLDGWFLLWGRERFIYLFISILSLETLNLPQQILSLAQWSWVPTHLGTLLNEASDEPRCNQTKGWKLLQVLNYKHPARKSIALNPPIIWTADFNAFPHGDTPADSQHPAGTSGESFKMPKPPQKQRWNIPNVAKGRRSTNFIAQTVHACLLESLQHHKKETPRNTACPELVHKVKNYPEIQVLIWEGGIYPTSPGWPWGDQFAHPVPHFPNGKEAKHNRTMCEDHILKTWKYLTF